MLRWLPAANTARVMPPAADVAGWYRFLNSRCPQQHLVPGSAAPFIL